MIADMFDLDAELVRLENKIDSLAAMCERLRDENQVLKSTLDEWMRERVQLSDKTEMAKSRVEAMISRLKSIGHE
ncbi:MULTISPECIES: TIGR02449 family protein [unclassified Methylocaldum]|jgi:cell division protein ZapB|uniref:TIGR02449 family protein n=2 Tax=unclassified Methylocaldum TaxID=2622260 RepID=UPI000989B085|nr:TIGR02449 family protein [Methylocaldum sp. RMAD-M]MDV3243014.1 TIGR02449 family protein [Methylocaldum sp.]MVF23485.1 TIGR02449 family protein [Methylocaldum sp. BRCS4]